MALIPAATGNNLIELAQLLSSGRVAVDETDRWGRTALMYAARTSVDSVRLLVDGGANISATSKDGDLPLHIAIREGRTLIAKYLVSQGCELNTVNKTGQSPLLCAILYSQPEVAKLLLGRGVRMDSALVYLAQKNVIDAVNMLVDMGADVNSADKVGDSALMLASREGNIHVVRLLLGMRADVNHQNGVTGLTSALYAASHNRVEVLTSLIEAGADLNRAGKKDGNTALLIAAKSGRVDMVRLLVASGCVDVDLVDRAGNSALMLSCLCKSSESVELLLSHGAALNVSNRAGESPLHAALRLGLGAESQTMVLLGARSDARDARGVTPMMIAAERGDAALLELMLARTAWSLDARSDAGDTALVLAAGLSRLAAVRLLLARGADPNLRNKERVSPLIAASKVGHPVIVELLVFAGARVNDADKDGNTALMFAARYGSIHIVLLLASVGADPAATNKDGRSALDCLRKEREREALLNTCTSFQRWHRRCDFVVLLLSSEFLRSTNVASGFDQSQRPANQLLMPSSSVVAENKVLSNFDLTKIVISFL